MQTVTQLRDVPTAPIGDLESSPNSDQILKTSSSFLLELATMRSRIQQACVENAICLDALHTASKLDSHKNYSLPIVSAANDH